MGQVGGFWELDPFLLLFHPDDRISLKGGGLKLWRRCHIALILPLDLSGERIKVVPNGGEPTPSSLTADAVSAPVVVSRLVAAIGLIGVGSQPSPLFISPRSSGMPRTSSPCLLLSRAGDRASGGSLRGRCGDSDHPRSCGDLSIALARHPESCSTCRGTWRSPWGHRCLHHCPVPH